MTDPRADLLARFDPDPDALVEATRCLIDADMLREIAAADYGQDVEKHLAALRPIAAGTSKIQLGSWYPDEVLALMRWSEPDDPTWKPGATGVRGHAIRAFCCALLLRGAAEPEGQNLLISTEDTLAQLMASLGVLGPEVQRAAGRFLAWRTPLLQAYEARPFFVMSLLITAAGLGPPGFGPSEIEALADWLIEEEAEERQAQEGRPHDRRWLLGLADSEQKIEVWPRLAMQMAIHARKHPESQRAQRLAQISRWLEGHPKEA